MWLRGLPMLLACILGGVARTQPTILMGQVGPLTTCNAIFLDPGGQQGHPTAGGTTTLTVCPDLAGAFLQLDISSIDLGPGAVLTVHDGDDTNAPVIATSQDLDLTLVVVQSSASSGCLTFTFTEGNGPAGAGWTGYLQCYLPCDVPTGQVVPFAESPLRICIGEAIALDGSGSSAAPGHTLTDHAWDMGNGTIINGPSASYAYTEAGEYTVLLRVTDDAGCTNTNYTGQQVQVGTRPDLGSTVIAPGSICVGETLTMSSEPEAVTWTNVPEPFVDGLVLLPDGIGVTYTANVEVGGFGQNAVVTTPGDIVEVCFTMEHSWIGDLIVSMVCPDGQSVLLFDGNSQGSVSTYLGAPNDDPSSVPGTGWQYCFSNVGALGTIVAENAAGNHVQAGVPVGSSMPAGSYTSQQSFSNWQGCSLNGNWQIQITDDQGADDGYISSWWITIDPALYPNVLEFTPVLGLDCDSSGWSGPALTQGPYCQGASATPTSTGPHVYNYSVTDDFGCTHDTSFTVQVTPALDFSVFAEPIPPCADHVQLGTELHQPVPAGPINFSWSPWQGLSSTTNPAPTATPTVPTWYRLWGQPFGHPLCGMMDSILVMPLTRMEHDTSMVEPLCHGGTDGSITLATTGNGGPWSYSWRDTSGVEVQVTDGVNSDTFTGQAGIYELHIAEGPAGGGCVDTLLLVLGEPAALLLTAASTDTTICLGGSATLQAAATGGTAPLTLLWGPGLAAGGSHLVAPQQTGQFVVHAVDDHGCSSDTAHTVITVRPPIGFSLPDTMVVCPEVATPLTIEGLAGGDGAYQYDWEPGPDGSEGIIMEHEASRAICVTVTDGCETAALSRCTWFEVLPLPDLLLSADTVEGCPGMAVAFRIEDTAGGAVVDWHYGDGLATLAGAPYRTHVYMQPGTHDVHARVLWPNGCYDDTLAIDMVHIEERPGAEFTWSPFPPNVEWPHVEFHELSGPAATDHRWVFHTGDTLTGPQVEYTYPSPVGGQYGVWHFASNYLGCTDSTYRVVEVDDAFLVLIPTGFTPNGDGFNDVLHIQGRDLGTTGFEWSIYDRWGQQVFLSTDRDAGWDGSIKGKEPVTGVYAWLLRATSAHTGLEHELRGHVTLVR